MNAAAPLFRQLTERVEDLSRNHRALAKYILANYQTVAFSTITQLAELSRVSEATIVRFAKALGFSGYPAFQKEIRRIVRADLKGTERFKLSDAQKRADNGPLDGIIEKELENLSHLRETFEPRAFGRAVAAIRAASRVVVAGARSTASLAHHFSFGLNKIAIDAARVVAINTETFDLVNALDRRALLIVIGFPRYLAAQVELIGFAKARKLATLAITDSPFSPLQGDVSVYAPAESASFVAFHGAPLVLINALLHELSRADPQRTLDALARFEALAEAERYFHQA